MDSRAIDRIADAFADGVEYTPEMYEAAVHAVWFGGVSELFGGVVFGLVALAIATLTYNYWRKANECHDDYDKANALIFGGFALIIPVAITVVCIASALPALFAPEGVLVRGIVGG